MTARSVGLGLLIVALACRGGSPAGPDPLPPTGDEVPIYGSCGVEPNYVGQVSLNRWRSFPLAYYFDAAAFSVEFLDDYGPAIRDGIGRWDAATENELGAVIEVQDPAAADFVITYRAITPLAATARAFHATGTPFLAGGEIVYNPTGMREGEELARDGGISPEAFRRGISGIAAHEMGHLLGIIGHSTRGDVLMGPEFRDAPTIYDVNTLMHAYCRV